MAFLPMKMKAGILCAGILLTGFEMKAQGNNERPAKVKLGPQLIRGPYLQVATTNSMVVRWRT